MISSDLMQAIRLLSVQYDTEDLIGAVREVVEGDLSAYVSACTTIDKRDEVQACLEACINHLCDAQTAYYASLK